jgi:hypothetical protein
MSLEAWPQQMWISWCGSYRFSACTKIKNRGYIKRKRRLTKLDINGNTSTQSPYLAQVIWRGVNVLQNNFKLCRIWGSHSGCYEGYYLWDITSCSPLNLGFPSTFMLVSCLAYLSLKMEAICSETSVDFQRTHGVITQKIVLFNFKLGWQCLA